MKEEGGHQCPQEHTIPHLWEGAERSGVGAQGPVAHPRHELQAEDLLQESGRAPAAAAPLALHPAAIHRIKMRGERPGDFTA